MNYIENLINPDRLLILWQSINPGDDESTGRRFVVGEVYVENNTLYLRYFDRADTREAQERHRFKGLTAYPYEPGKIYDGNVKDILAKRVASPERLDYADYLRSYRIPPERASELSLLQLLAYTGGKLTGDGFCFVPTFRSLTPPYDFVFEIAGFRHWKGMTINPITSLLDQDVSLIKEPENEQDADAIAIYYDHKKIGYVPRGLATDLGDGIMDEYHVAACVTKVNGTQERPKISVLVRVS